MYRDQVSLLQGNAGSSDLFGLHLKSRGNGRFIWVHFRKRFRIDPEAVAVFELSKE